MNQNIIYFLLFIFVLALFYALYGLWQTRVALPIKYQNEISDSIALKKESIVALKKELYLRWPNQQIYLQEKQGIYGILWTYLPSEKQKETVVIVLRYLDIFPVFEVLDDFFQRNILVKKKIKILFVENNPSQAFIEFSLQHVTILETRTDNHCLKGISYQQQAVWDIYFKEDIDIKKILAYFVDCHLHVIKNGIRISFPNKCIYQKAKSNLKHFLIDYNLSVPNIFERYHFPKSVHGLICSYQYSLPNDCTFIGLGYHSVENTFYYMEQLKKCLQ